MISISTLSDFIESHPKAPDEIKEHNPIPTLAIQWARAEELVWTLRLTEFFGDIQGGWGYQPDVEWQVNEHGAMSYTDRPISIDPAISGTASACVQPGDDCLTFEITLKNNSSETWKDCWGWVCLIHRWARSFQANCELPTGGTPAQAWMPANALSAPLERWLKWCPVQSKREIATRIGENYPTRWQPHIHAVQGAVRAWRVIDNKQQFIELSSSDAIILGWSHWPCTDMGLYFGTLEARQTATVSAQLRFFEKSFVPI
jgi:hypothetical protein